MDHSTFSRRDFLKWSGVAAATLALPGCATSKLLFSGSTNLTVMNSGGFSAAYKALIPTYEAQTKNHLISVYGPSMGKSPEAIPTRLARGEYADVIIMVGYALDKLIAAGLVYADSKTELADSRIGVVVKKGAPAPKINTPADLRHALLQAPSIAYSDSASGRYIEEQLFKKLGIEDQVKGKAHMVEKTPVAQKVAEGTYALGFQQISEILPIQGVSYLGKIPEELQSITTFSAGIAKRSKHPKQAAELIKFLTSAQAKEAIIKSGMDLK